MIARHGPDKGLAFNVRLDGAPLFTFPDGQRNFLKSDNSHAFTWPTEVPAYLKAHAYDRAL
jgi:hypothetical protein